MTKDEARERLDYVNEKIDDLFERIDRIETSGGVAGHLRIDLNRLIELRDSYQTIVDQGK